MKKLFFLFCFLSFAVSAQAKNFVLKSPQISEGQVIKNEQVFNGFGCSGKNISPELSWEGAPSETKSFAVTMYDPDAPTGSGWWHWTVFNIPASAKKIPFSWSSILGINTLGTQGRTDFGTSVYGGPCPPAGDKAHRYIFTVYALKIDKIPLNAEASGAMLGFYIQQNKIAEAKLTAIYSR